MKTTSWRNSWVCPGNIPRWKQPKKKKPKTKNPRKERKERRRPNQRMLPLRERLLHLQQRRLRFRQRNRDSVISGDRRQRNQTKPNTATLVLLRRGSCCV